MSLSLCSLLFGVRDICVCLFMWSNFFPRSTFVFLIFMQNKLLLDIYVRNMLYSLTHQKSSIIFVPDSSKVMRYKALCFGALLLLLRVLLSRCCCCRCSPPSCVRCCCCCCFSHSAHWLPTRKRLLCTVANPARGLLNRGKKEKSGSARPPQTPPPPPRCSFGRK